MTSFKDLCKKLTGTADKPKGFRLDGASDSSSTTAAAATSRKQAAEGNPESAHPSASSAAGAAALTADKTHESPAQKGKAKGKKKAGAEPGPDMDEVRKRRLEMAKKNFTTIAGDSPEVRKANKNLTMTLTQLANEAKREEALFRQMDNQSKLNRDTYN